MHKDKKNIKIVKDLKFKKSLNQTTYLFLRSKINENYYLYLAFFSIFLTKQILDNINFKQYSQPVIFRTEYLHTFYLRPIEK